MIKLIFVLVIIIALSVLFSLVGFTTIFNWFSTFFQLITSPLRMIIDVLITFAEIIFYNYYMGLFLGVLVVSAFFRFVIDHFRG